MRKIVALSEIYGTEATARALDDAFEYGAFSSDYITNLLEARARTPPEPSALHLTRRSDLLDSNSQSPTSRSTTSPETPPMTRRKPAHDLDAFHTHLDALKLSFVREHYADVVRSAAEEQRDHLSVLERLIEGEANLRRDRSIQRRIRLARFPVKKTLDSFDWSWPKKINRLQVQNLFRLRFLDDASNVVLVGGVGLGKSHLVTALGLRACECGHSVLFTSAIDAINTLAAAKAAGQLKRDLARYLRPRLLILDELGYLPIDKTGADLLFQIISQRYERGSIAITTIAPTSTGPRSSTKTPP